MPTYRGKKVSREHADVLKAYESKYNTPVQINSGKRTLAEQTDLYRAYKRGGTLAAPPYAHAPHIKEGHVHHALDINAGSRKGQARHVARFYRSLGIKVSFNVKGEPWHMDTTNERSLIRGAAKARKRVDPTLRRGSRSTKVVTLKKLLKANGVRGFSTKPTGGPGDNRFDPFFGKYTEEAVKRFQKRHDLTADGIVGTTTWKKLRG